MSPLPVLLSQSLVAFTIEFDNESEHRIVHWTTNGGRGDRPSGAPWLVSQVLWVNVLQYIGDDAIRVADLRALARTDWHATKCRARRPKLETEGRRHHPRHHIAGFRHEPDLTVWLGDVCS